MLNLEAFVETLLLKALCNYTIALEGTNRSIAFSVRLVNSRLEKVRHGFPYRRGQNQADRNWQDTLNWNNVHLARVVFGLGPRRISANRATISIVCSPQVGRDVGTDSYAKVFGALGLSSFRAIRLKLDSLSVEYLRYGRRLRVYGGSYIAPRMSAKSDRTSNGPCHKEYCKMIVE
jgi:hypothetical protein